MAQVRDELLTKEMTSAELKVLVDEWMAAGGVITQCAPGVALNFRVQLGQPNDTPSHRRSPRRPQIRRSSVKGKSAKNKKKS
jgi:hypothetical protein